MKEYIPTEEDLRDFEEFKAERECMERENEKSPYVTMYYISKGDEVLKLTRSAITDLITHTISVIPNIKEYALVDRLNPLELLGYDKYELVSVISPELSKRDIDDLFDNKPYPYLYSGLSSVVSDERIDKAIADREFAREHKLIPSSLFCEVYSLADKELLRSKHQIVNLYKNDRPLSWLRPYILKKGKDAGVLRIKGDINSDEPIRVQTRKFLQILCYCCQDIPITMRYQFNIIVSKRDTKYSDKKPYVTFSIPVSMLPIIESYFNVRFGYKHVIRRGYSSITFTTPIRKKSLFK